jgi:hypothetical protein
MYSTTFGDVLLCITQVLIPFYFISRTSCLVLSVSYGYVVNDEHDPLLKKMVHFLEEVIKGVLPGNWLVDFIPVRSYPWFSFLGPWAFTYSG